LKKGLIVAHLLTLVLVAAGLAGCNSNEDEASSEQVFEVKRGDLLISVSSDGNLVMPQAFDLHFGAPGDVKDVLVEEGDYVKAGTILAQLDDTAQRLDIMSANNNVQTVLSNLYETVPLLPQFPINGPDSGSGPGYPFYYPNRTALISFAWAQDEVYRARELFQADNYTGD
jgi:multidrug efflux pump subunit AcrA (membrane-fusion protein)